MEVRLTEKGARRLAQLANLHRAELLSPQGDFTVPDLDAFDRE